MASDMEKGLQQVIRNILKDIKVELGDEFDRNFERQGFFSEKWQRRKSPKRSAVPNCHDPAVCGDWAAYQDALANPSSPSLSVP